MNQCLIQFECQCASQGFCPVFSRVMLARPHSICKGVARSGDPPIPSELRQQYLKLFRRESERNRLRMEVRSKVPQKCKAGSELRILLKKLRLKPSKKCLCGERAGLMDVNGCDWCSENIDMIVGWLREEANNLRLPFSNTAARTVVKLAIRRARQKESIST